VVGPVGAARAPAVVLAHGFAGSAAMMDPLATALARAGYLVVLPDLPGHGANSAALTDDSLEPAIAQAVQHASAITGGPVAVAGHSMGAGAVTSWALGSGASAEPAAPVAISLPSAEDLPADPARPRNLLLLWGSAEQERFVEAALSALRLGYPDGRPGRTYGSAAEGTARRAQQISGAEHITVVYREQTAGEMADWLGGGQPRGDARAVGLALVLLGGLMVTRPLLAGPRRVAPAARAPAARAPAARAPAADSASGAPAAGTLDAAPAIPTGPPGAPGPSIPVGSAAPGAGRPEDRLSQGAVAGHGAGLGRAALGTVGWLALAAVVAAGCARVVQSVAEQVPVAVAGYLTAWFVGGGLVLLVVAGRRAAQVGTWGGAARGALAGAVLSACLALPARVTWAAFELVGPRWLVLPAILAASALWFWAEARMLDGCSGGRRAGVLAASRSLIVVGLLGAVALLGAPGFLTLTVPLIIPILALLAVVAWWSRDPAAAASAQANPLSLAIATTFPIIG
jgi:pimeloyl-ACP methyl ester carboxylesterase